MGVDIDVAHAVEMLDHRHFRFARDALDEALAAARHDDVDVLVVGDEMSDRRTVGRRDDLHGVLGQSGGAKAAMHAGGDGLIAADRLGAAAQDRRIAGLEAQPGGIRRHVRPRFVDDADHTQRHAHPSDLDPGGPVLEIGDLADGIGQRGDGFETRRHRVDRVGVERQPVDERGVMAGGRRGGDVLGVRRDQGGDVLADSGRHRHQCRILGARARPRDVTRGGTRGLADALHVGADVGERAETGDGEIGHRAIVARSRAGGEPRPVLAEWLDRAHAFVATEQDDVGAARREESRR